MDLALKYRIVGAIVLVSLAVIFVPIVLDGSGHESADGSGHRQNIRSDLNIPPEPEFIDEQPAVRAGWKQQMETSTQTVTDADDLAQGIHPEVSLAKGASDKLISWVVQVGAFGEREKALALKKQLADEKLDLFIEVAGEKQKRVYRVKVGPMISHEKAEQMQLRLVDKFKLTAAFVSSYPRVEP
ncbi:SPOR domain-containing protein [Gammaproteobacteria bacterium]|jgi:DedD protein|nr:hypothetical protein [Pseudomonadota bacterium]MDC1284510.1 SPOR domain-containing protein [Gammaproteobacteria bacterium]